VESLRQSSRVTVRMNRYSRSRRRDEYQHRRNGASPRNGAGKSDNDKEVVHVASSPIARRFVSLGRQDARQDAGYFSIYVHLHARPLLGRGSEKCNGTRYAVEPLKPPTKATREFGVREIAIPQEPPGGRFDGRQIPITITKARIQGFMTETERDDGS
jgi:hypothetical protein